MALTIEQLNKIIDEGLRTEAEKARAQKARLGSLLIRCNQVSQIDVNEKAPVVLTRSDATQLPILENKNLIEFITGLTRVQAALQTIPNELLELFCVRGIEIKE